MAIRVGARNDSLAMIRRALPVTPPSGPPKLAWTSTVWPAIGCPVWPGWIGPKRAIKRRNMVVLVSLIFQREARSDLASSTIGSSHAARAAKDAGERSRVNLVSPERRETRNASFL